MSINIKKYTKEQMAKMVEEAVERHESLKSENADLAEKVKKEMAEKLALRNKLANTEAALGRANAEVSRLTVGCRQVEEERDYMHQQWSNARWDANYAEAHPWRNLWAWVKRKLGCKA